MPCQRPSGVRGFDFPPGAPETRRPQKRASDSPKPASGRDGTKTKNPSVKAGASRLPLAYIRQAIIVNTIVLIFERKMTFARMRRKKALPLRDVIQSLHAFGDGFKKSLQLSPVVDIHRYGLSERLRSVDGLRH